MAKLDSGGGGGGGYATLNSVGTSRFNVVHPNDADARDDYEPQLQADVSAPYTGGSYTVAWYFESTKVAERTHTLDPYEDRTFARRVSWSTMDAKGLVPGDYKLKAKLTNTGATTSYGTMHLHEQEAPSGGGSSGGGDESGPGSCPDGYYYDTAFGMCLQGDTSGGGGDDGGSNDGGDSGPSEPQTPASLLPADFPTLPPVGPLNAEQTTLAAIVGVPLLLVLLK